MTTNKKNKHGVDELDTLISAHVRMVKYGIPGHVDTQVGEALYEAEKQDARPKRSIPFWPYRLAWPRLSVPAAAVLLLAAIFFIFQPLWRATPSAPPVKPISEIKTEWELPGDNIKILWVQKKDFELNMK
jgi:quinol-cytochrome oxidoreductase complex cytochrome b subunit